MQMFLDLPHKPLDPCQEWVDAVLSRDKSYAGQFVYGVKTTKIVCPVNCPAAVPLAENIEFFQDYDHAEKNGYRRCWLRCGL